MNLIWTPEAEDDRAQIWDYIAADNPLAAIKMDKLFSVAANTLTTHPGLGRSGKISGTRELVVHENYRIVYEVDDETVWILTLVHTARRWPPVR